MIITRTPFRVSFFGGGTDYPEWYRTHGGAVIAATINKYCYISCRSLPPFFAHKHRIVYSSIENVQEISEIKHPSVRATLHWAGINKGLEIHHDGDLPACSGLGSSSAFTVGLVKCLYAMKGQMVSQEQLASDAINIEQNIIGENVGSQDQISASYGGLNVIKFHKDDSFDVSPLIISAVRQEELQKHLMLFFTGVSRISDSIAKSTIENLAQREKELFRMREMVTEATEILTRRETPIEKFGELLDENWQYKKTLSERISTPTIDEIYEAGKSSGALGGKILGAGGGGFILFFVKPYQQKRVRESLRRLVNVDFKFENSGSKVIFYQPNGIAI